MCLHTGRLHLPAARADTQRVNTRPMCGLFGTGRKTGILVAAMLYLRGIRCRDNVARDFMVNHLPRAFDR